MEINEAVLDEALTYLFARNASRLRFLQYARWRRTLKWHFQDASDEEIRTIFTMLKRRGHFIAKKLFEKGHRNFPYFMICSFFYLLVGAYMYFISTMA